MLPMQTPYIVVLSGEINFGNFNTNVKKCPKTEKKLSTGKAFAF